jgi:hypothetical protein
MEGGKNVSSSKFVNVFSSIVYLIYFFSKLIYIEVIELDSRRPGKESSLKQA